MEALRPDGPVPDEGPRPLPLDPVSEGVALLILEWSVVGVRETSDTVVVERLAEPTHPVRLQVDGTPCVR